MIREFKEMGEDLCFVSKKTIFYKSLDIFVFCGGAGGIVGASGGGGNCSCYCPGLSGMPRYGHNEEILMAIQKLVVVV